MSIIETAAIAWCVAAVSPLKIDEINILNANMVFGFTTSTNSSKDTLLNFASNYKRKEQNKTYLHKQNAFGTGLQYKALHLDYHFQKISNLYFYTSLKRIEQDIFNYTYSDEKAIAVFQNGFINNENTYRNLHKLVFSLKTKRQDIKQKWLKDAFVQTNFAYTLQWGKEHLPDGDISYIRQTPRNTFRMAGHLQLSKSFSLSWLGIYASSFLPSYTTAGNIETLKQQNTASRTTDLFVNYNFNDNLQGQLRILNLRNNRNAGIEATETPNDLFFNSQPLRTFQLGLKYNLDKRTE